MGVHICLEYQDGIEVREWDFVRQSYDRELDDFLCEIQVEEDFSTDERRIRPDLDALAGWIKDLPVEDKPRYWQLHRLLSAEDCWIRLSR